jgi:hypothetical protein
MRRHEYTDVSQDTVTSNAVCVCGFFREDLLHPTSTYLLTYSMEQSPSCEANWFCSYSRNIPYLWNPKVHYRTHKSPPPVPILSPLHQVPTIPSHVLKIPLNIILPSTSGSPQWSLSLRIRLMPVLLYIKIVLIFLQL